jgi:signal transduction histidine kinase
VKFLLEVVAEEAGRLNRMVGDLLDYSRPLQPALEPVHLRTLVHDAIAAARPLSEPSAAAGAAEAAVEVSVEVADNLWVRADPRLLRQALINLVLNSFQAMPKGGALRVLASLSGSAGGAATQQSVRVVIEDTGPGIPAESRARVFQPFFTTKATGTGLGLAVVKRILERHGGSVGVTDRERGAAFHLVLAADAAP